MLARIFYQSVMTARKQRHCASNAKKSSRKHQVIPVNSNPGRDAKSCVSTISGRLRASAVSFHTSLSKKRFCRSEVRTVEFFQIYYHVVIPSSVKKAFTGCKQRFLTTVT
jgi:hypothetical protein